MISRLFNHLYLNFYAEHFWVKNLFIPDINAVSPVDNFAIIKRRFDRRELS